MYLVVNDTFYAFCIERILYDEHLIIHVSVLTTTAKQLIQNTRVRTTYFR